MKNKGISLIVLVITIVVIIILAAAVILSLGDNNPINSSRIAKILQDKESIESAILTYTGSMYTKTLGKSKVSEIIRGNIAETVDYGIVGTESLSNKDGEIIYNIDKTKYEKKVNKLPDVADSSWWVEASSGKVYLVYEESSNVPNWIEDNETLNSFVIAKDDIKYTAKAVEKNPNVYYGATVTNYSVNGISDFKVFHSDGKNIYLISSDYIPVDKIPLTKSGNTLANTNTNYPKAAPLTNAVSDSQYSTGTGAIDASNNLRKWISSYLNQYLSENNNIKSAAYMLDTSVWNVYKNDMADYAIGGPTIEMFIASYNKKHGTNYMTRAKDINGYEISKDEGENWNNEYSNMIETSDTLYVLPASNEALGMWINSPSANSDSSMLFVRYSGYVGYRAFTNADVGFRPVICLKSSVSLKKNADGSVELK